MEITALPKAVVVLEQRSFIPVLLSIVPLPFCSIIPPDMVPVELILPEMLIFPKMEDPVALKPEALI